MLSELEKREQAASAKLGREAAVARAVEAAERGDIRTEEAAITDALRFEGVRRSSRKRWEAESYVAAGFLGWSDFLTIKFWIWRDRIVSRDGLFLVDESGARLPATGCLIEAPSARVALA